MKSSFSRALQTTFACAAVAALAAGASGARAQSSVQLYGQVDEWIGAQKFPGGQRAWGVQGGGMSTSYWGLRGTEDLGGGYQAIFTLEDFFRAQNGHYSSFDGDTFFGRNAYVGLATPYGTVRAGDLPPTNRASRSLVKFVFGEEDEHEEALYGTANHRVSEGSRG
ncbi:porin, partial [Burkholderia mallei]